VIDADADLVGDLRERVGVAGLVADPVARLAANDATTWPGR
jgi:hypothetical protein